MPEAALALADFHTERFEVVRIERPDDLPPRDARTIEVALLDMNHGFPNVGHDAIVALVRDASLEFEAELAPRNRRVRLLSYAVRDKVAVPDHASARHRLYLGSGGPGHLDPRRNTASNGTQEILENPAWEEPLWRLFDAIAADETAALFGVCHTFGLVCRWSGIAQPVLRSAQKGGRMSGLGTNVLTPQALAHPWFAALAAESPTRAFVPVLDSRHYDMIPVSSRLADPIVPIAFETSQDGSRSGEALTMVEIARAADGAPRFFAVNSHPEIGTAERIAELLERMLRRGTIPQEVYAERSAMLPLLQNDRHEERLRVGRYVFGDLVRRSLEGLVA